MTTIAAKITKRIRTKQRGWVFTPKDFLDFGMRATVDQTLSRLAAKGIIRRLDRGLYDYPKQHAVLGLLSPDADAIAAALSAWSGDTVFPSGAAAANYLGLSTQVPAKPVYLTNGASRTKKIGKRTITLKHARVSLLDKASQAVNSTLQALSYLGKDNVDADIIHKCATRLDAKDVKALTKAKPVVPSWMADVIQKIELAQHG
jgi:predicted transcriptional regulator of viral defense system